MVSTKIGGLIDGVSDFNDNFDIPFEGLGGASLWNPLGIEESYLYEQRSATRIFDDHQDIAVRNIGGAEIPSFNENQNLYGFSIFQYKTGFGTGWNVANPDTLLGFDLTNSLTGGDQVANVSSYFFNLHPNSMGVSEPFATQIVPTQGSGVYMESQGVVLRSLSISGTTGYRPSIQKVRNADRDRVIPHITNEATGYLNFLKLRNVFRNYSDLKKNPRQAYKFYMIWYNGKEQEAWFFEPTDFSLNRDASSPFTYKYNISGTLVQKVYFSSIVARLDKRFEGMHYYLDSLRKAESVLTGGILGALTGQLGIGNLNDWKNLINGFNETLNNAINQVHGYVGAASTITAIPALILTGIISTCQTFMRTGKNALDEYKALKTANLNILNTPEFDEYWEEKVNNFENFIVNTMQDSLEALNLLKEQAGDLNTSANYSKKNSALRPSSFTGNTSSSGALPDDTNWSQVRIPSDVLNLDFYEFLSSHGVPIALADVVAEFNGLTYPYISNQPTSKQSLSSVKVPGDFIFLPVESKPFPPNLNTKLPYNLQPGANLHQETLGRDIKLIKTTPASGAPQFNFSISPTGDIDLVGGNDNMMQAIDLKMNTYRGELPLHKGYGFVPMVGVKGTRNLNFNLYLSLNDTMLSDARIEDLSNVRISTKGDETAVSFRANIIGQVPYVPVTFTTKG